MLGDTLKKKVLSIITRSRSDVISVVVFGSTIYMGRGRDIDIIVVVEKYIRNQVSDSVNLRLTINRELGYKVIADVHVFTINDFRNNLRPGTFLSGLALGYEILYDKTRGLVERLIEDMLVELSREEYTLVNAYGKWRLNIHAQRMLERIRKKHAV